DVVRRPGAELPATVPIVADVGRHADVRPAAAVEIIDARAEDRGPAVVVARILIERLEVALAQGEVVARLVARAIDATELEEQRTELIAQDRIEEPGRGVTLDTPDRTVRSVRLRVVLTPLVGKRGVETEGPDAPARVQTDRVTFFVHRGVAAREGVGGGVVAERQGAVHRATYRAAIHRVTPRRTGRHTVRVEPREHRLQIQPFERRELRADDERIVLAAV